VPVAALITIGAIVIIAAAYFVVVWVLRTYRKQVAAGREDLIGKTAVVKSALAPKGVVLVEGERWTAVIDKGNAQPEEEVTVTRVDGLKLTVTKNH
jgi:membrane-bound serine protease (ClpP class)